MELKDIASVSGKAGLFKVLKPTRNGVILESIDETQKKFIAGQSQRVSLLKEISLYTTSSETSVALEDVFKKIKSLYKNTLPVHAKSEGDDLKDFIEKVVPDYDREKVYLSDIKKLISWYEILQKFSPELLEPSEATQEEPESKSVKTTEEKPSPSSVKPEATTSKVTEKSKNTPTSKDKNSENKEENKNSSTSTSSKEKTTSPKEQTIAASTSKKSVKKA